MDTLARHSLDEPELPATSIKRTKPQPVYRLEITLLDTDPPVWRRIEVPGSMR